MVKSLLSKRTANQSGYSLVEIFVTLSVAAILAAVTLPSLTRVFSAPPESEQLERLRRTLTDTRNRTILSDVCATATASGNELTTIFYRTCTTTPPTDVIETRSTQFPNLNLESFEPTSTLRFAIGGGLFDRRQATMRIRTQTNRIYEIRILPAIGNIRMNERRE
jgi:prepilin-type N-terminal cleavage/methylation domain-containing protein